MSYDYEEEIKEKFAEASKTLSKMVASKGWRSAILGQPKVSLNVNGDGRYVVHKTITLEDRHAIKWPCDYCKREDNNHEFWCIWHRETLELSCFCVRPLSGNDRIAVVSDVKVHGTFRRKGVGKLLHKMRLDALKKGGVKLVLCTANDSNKNELAILSRNKWHASEHFDNVTLFAKNLE